VYGLPYEVHYILDLLLEVGYNVTSIDQHHMYDILMGVNWTDFVIDEYVVEDFFNQLGIDSSTFDQEAWEAVKAELQVIDLPIQVNEILDLLQEVGYDTTNLS